MNILIDIGHPAHVHLFKNFSWQMQKKGYNILFTCREKEFEIDLLTEYKFDYISFGKKHTSKIGKILGMLEFDWKMFKVSRKFKPDIFLSAGSMYAAQISSILKKPHISSEDTGNMEQINLYRPFTNNILVPSAFHKNLGNKQLKYRGYHELAYLYPKYFKPDIAIFDSLGINRGEKFVILRFVSWNASHDINQSGMTDKLKRELIEKLNRKFHVFISSEKILPEEFTKFKLPTSPEMILDVLYYAELFIGEGATMASECAMLGTPAIYVNSITAGTLEEQEKYGLIYGFRDSNGVLTKMNELINTSNLKNKWKKKRDKMLADKIDVTAFFVWFIENYPGSAKIMKENPEYQERFK